MNTNDKFLIIVVPILYFMFTLESFGIAGIPFRWLSLLGFISLLIIIPNKREILKSNFFYFFLFFLLYAITINIFNLKKAYYYKSIFPPRATTSYYIFISLRYISLMSFLATVILFFYLSKNKKILNKVINGMIIVAIINSLYALYYYYGKKYGLPTFSQNLMTTSGTTNWNIGYGDVNRATGFFKEPSHLASWLILPIFFSLYQKRKKVFFLFFITLLLTVSLNGIFSFITGIASILLFVNKRIFIKYMGVIILIISILFLGYVINPKVENFIFKRIEKLQKGGIKKSNRDYVYEYLKKESWPIWGVGLGNSNILFSRKLGSPLIVSFLSLYTNYLFSFGIVGFFLMLGFLFFPIIYIFIKRRDIKNDDLFITAISTYIALLVILIAKSEEMTINLGVAYGMILSLSRTLFRRN